MQTVKSKLLARYALTRFDPLRTRGQIRNNFPRDRCCPNPFVSPYNYQPGRKDGSIASRMPFTRSALAWWRWILSDPKGLDPGGRFGVRSLNSFRLVAKSRPTSGIRAC
jgi:hypothetical protein